VSTTAEPVARIASAIDAAMSNPDTVIPAPLKPPASWFRDLPEDYVPPPQGPLVQIDLTTGRVAALVAPYGECILDGRSGCWTPGRSKTNYEYAHVGAIVTAEGETIRTANVGGGINHFDVSLATAASLAADHYANTATRRMVGRYVDMPDIGIMFLGSMYPGSTHLHAYEAMTSALSGDWRWIESLRDHEMVGAQLVNNPGFRPNPLRALRPVVASVSFRSTGAKVATATGCTDAATIVSEWTPVNAEREPLTERFARLEALTAGLMVGAVDDAPLLPPDPVDIMDLDDDGDEGEDWIDELDDLTADECRFCRGVGCAKCDWMGYTGDDDEAMVASLRANEAIIARLRRPRTGAERPRDGDGDGFVYDGTPRMRPFNPLTDLVGRAVTMADVQEAASGNRAARNKVRQRAARNFDMAVEGKQRPDVDKLIEATIGPKPADVADQMRWMVATRDVREVFDLKRRGAVTPGAPGDDPDRRPGNADPLDGRAPRSPSEVAVDRATPNADSQRMSLDEAVQRDVLPARDRGSAETPFTPTDDEPGEMGSVVDDVRTKRAKRRLEKRFGYKAQQWDDVKRRSNFDAKQEVADLEARKARRRDSGIGPVYMNGRRVSQNTTPFIPDGEALIDAASAPDPDAPDTPDLAAKVLADGGFTYDPDTGTFPDEGIAVAVPGHSVIAKRDAFEADPDKFINDYLRQMRDDGVTDTMIGGWYDTANDEVVLDRVQVVADRDEAMRLGVSRDEQAVYDLSTGEEIPTGGTGGRDDIDIIGQEAAGDGPSRQADQGPDGRGDRPAVEGPVGEDGGPAAPEGVSPFTPGSDEPGEMGSTPSAIEPVTFDGVEYPEARAQAAAAAARVHARAEAAEPEITSLLEEFAAGAGGRLHKSEYKFKGIGNAAEGGDKGISGKILRKLKGKKAPTQEEIDGTAEEIGDALRYTAVFGEDTYSENAVDLLGALQLAGHEIVDVDNYWEKGDAYLGVNIEMRSPNGTTWELQLHTEASTAAVTDNHGLYDFTREPGGKEWLRLEASRIMTDRWADVAQPEGWDTVFAQLPLADGTTVGVAPLRRGVQGLEAWKPTEEFGLIWDPNALPLGTTLRNMDEGGAIDWDAIEPSTISPDEIGRITATESFLDGEIIDDLITGKKEMRRDDYPVKLYRDANGELTVVDGNTRLAVYLGRGEDMPVVIYDGPVEGMQGFDRATVKEKKDGSIERPFENLPESLPGGERKEFSADPLTPSRELSEAMAGGPAVTPERQGFLDAGTAWAESRGITIVDDSAIGADARAEMEARAAALPTDPAARYDALADVFDGGIGDELTGKAIHNRLGANRDQYGAARRAVHRELVAEIEERLEAAGIPKGRVALFTGGLPGAGKTYQLGPDGQAGDFGAVVWDLADPEPPPGVTHVAVSADYIKLRMAELGLNPGIKGLKPMEEAGLMHGESQDITRQLEKRLAAAGYNLAIDGTMRDEGQVRKQLKVLEGAGYAKPDAVVVDIPADESIDSAAARYTADALANPELGGRYVPPRNSAGRQSRFGYNSVVRDNLDYLVASESFGRVAVVDNTGVSNAQANSLADVNPSAPLPWNVADRIRGDMPEAEWRAALDERGITVGKAASVTARAEGGSWTVRDGEEFTSDDIGPGGFLRRPVERALQMPGVDGGAGTKDDPLRVSDVNTAAVLLIEGEHFIELKTPQEVSAVLDDVRDLVLEAKAAGRKPGNYDLCKITVPGTNLFCAETKGYPRVQMPQLSTENPIPGSFADKLERSQWGDVNLVPYYLDHIRSLGIDVEDMEVEAQDLKATQAELLGSKIIRNYDQRMRELKRDPKSVGRRIIVTRDGYIVDGHHGWAGNVAASYAGDQKVMQAVTVIDRDIVEVLALTNAWAIENGSPPADITGASVTPPPSAPTTPTGRDLPAPPGTPTAPSPSDAGAVVAAMRASFAARSRR